MKKCFILFTLVFFFGCGKKEEQVLNIYNWFDYIDEQVLRDFEKENNCKINYDTYSTNEEMLAKLQAGATGYDLCFPTGYMVDIMVKDGIVQKLDKTQLTNFGNINPKFLNLQYDPNNDYSVPYMYGFTAIGYRTDVVKSEEVASWKAFWNNKFKNQVIFMDDMREVFGVAFKILGYSVNDTDPKHLEEAKQLLIEQKKLLKKYETTMSKDLLLNKEASIIHQWTGDIMQLQEQDSTIGIAVPQEGTIIFIDNGVIPKSAPHQDLALKFLNYLMKPEVSAKIVNKVWYASPITEAVNHVSEEIKNDPNIYLPQSTFDKSEVLNDLGDYNKVMEKAWTELKSF